MKTIKKEKIKDYTVVLFKDEGYDDEVYIVQVKSGVFTKVIKRCKFRPNAEQVFKDTVKEYKTKKRHY